MCQLPAVLTFSPDHGPDECPICGTWSVSEEVIIHLIF